MSQLIGISASVF